MSRPTVDRWLRQLTPDYSAPQLAHEDMVWQAHLADTSDGWIGWSTHGTVDNPQQQASIVCQNLDRQTVVDALNERLDGRAQRGFSPTHTQRSKPRAEDKVVWIDDRILRKAGVKLTRPKIAPLSRLSKSSIKPPSHDGPSH